MKPLCAFAAIAVLFTFLTGPARADIALTTAYGSTSKLYLYNDDGTAKNIFGGSNMYSGLQYITDVAVLSTGDIAMTSSVGLSGTPGVRILSSVDGSEVANITMSAYPERIASLPGGGFAVAQWYTATSHLNFYDYNSGSHSWSAGPTVDLDAVLGYECFGGSSAQNYDITLAGGQMSSATPDLAVLAYGSAAHNSYLALAVDRNGIVGETQQALANLISRGITADPVGGAVDSAVKATYTWPTVTDFVGIVPPASQTNYSDGVGTAAEEAWVDVAVLTGGSTQLLALSSYSTARTLYNGVYPVTLSGSTATIGAQLIALPENNMSRMDATLVPEPATLGLLGLGIGGLAALRRRRK